MDSGLDQQVCEKDNSSVLQEEIIAHLKEEIIDLTKLRSLS
jgi:hypothetical protein